MSNNKQKTAVEWQYIELSKFLTGFSEFTHKSDILIKAKEMEKEEIIDFAMKFMMQDRPIISFYNETFGGNP